MDKENDIWYFEKNNYGQWEARITEIRSVAGNFPTFSEEDVERYRRKAREIIRREMEIRSKIGKGYRITLKADFVVHEIEGRTARVTYRFREFG